jgi:pimeloyl-ACP methyl ester carboxylesterase
VSEETCTVGDVDLCFERFGDPADPAMLLVRGLGTQMLGWHEEFCQALAARGFHVVRFDNRDNGRSTFLSHVPPPTLKQLALRDRSAAAYSLDDMADDAAGLLDHLGIERVRDAAGLSYERQGDPAGPGRQLAAVIESGDRTAKVRRISVPTLVVHGKSDKLVRPSGGRATAKAIPGARLMLIDGMGHDLPVQVWPRLIDAIVENAGRAVSATPAAAR